MEPFAIPLPRPLLAVHAPTMPGHAQAPSCDPKLLEAVMDSALSFGQRNFARVELGHQRSTNRLVDLADLMVRHPGGSLPDKLNVSCVLRAMYRLVNRPRTTHAAIMGGHADHTRERIAAAQGATVLLIHDATELDYTSKTTLRGALGQIGRGTRRGYICHNSLAVRADTGAVLGLASQILHHRADRPEKKAATKKGSAKKGSAKKGSTKETAKKKGSTKETAKQSRERANRESRLWLRGALACGEAPAGVRCVDVSDSLSDTFEHMAFEIANGRLFVLRAKENRRLQEPLHGQDLLFDGVRRAGSSGERTVKVQASPGRRARTATVQVSYTKVTLAPPGKRLGEYASAPLELWAVRVWEPDTPEGEEPLEWVLLTNVEVASFADATERVEWYELRWIVEELHKGMKTGCAIEKMQFTTTARLEPAIALLSAVATTLLALRDAARAPDAAKRPATEAVAAEYVEVLSSHYASRVKEPLTVLAFFLLVARLGGHQNRKCDGFPGWITLWRGWMKLQAMVDGYQAAQRSRPKSCGKT